MRPAPPQPHTFEVYVAEMAFCLLEP